MQIKEGEQLISQKTYEDEDGNEVTEKVYVTFDKRAAKSAMSMSSINGTATYTKEETFYIKTGKYSKGKIKCSVTGTFDIKNGKATATKVSGKVKTYPSGVTIRSPKSSKKSNYVCFRFYAKSNFAKEKEYKVTLTALGNGTVY